MIKERIINWLARSHGLIPITELKVGQIAQIKRIIPSYLSVFEVNQLMGVYVKRVNGRYPNIKSTDLIHLDKTAYLHIPNSDVIWVQVLATRKVKKNNRKLIFLAR